MVESARCTKSGKRRPSHSLLPSACCWREANQAASIQSYRGGFETGTHVHFCSSSPRRPQNCGTLLLSLCPTLCTPMASV